jgi:hypothetical protein
MRHRAVFIGSVAVLLASSVPGQVSPPQIQRDIALGQTVAKDIERRDGRIDDASIGDYLQRIEKRIASAAGVKPAEVRVTRSTLLSVTLLPNGVLYLSGGLLERIDSEAELAGLLAHEMAHGPWAALPGSPLATIPLIGPSCVLSSPFVLGGTQRREPELQATETAVKTLKAAGYDPEAVLDLFSKLSYEQPRWSKAIVSDDLLNLRATLDSDVPPVGGYLVDASEFRQVHEKLSVILGLNVGKPRRPAPSLSLR